MQIRATVKWRQSLPLTRAAANHPPAFSSCLFPLPARLSLAVHWTRRVFQFLTHRRHSPPPSSRSSAARAPDFHTPAAATATAPPHQVERVEVRTLPSGSACLTRLRRVVPLDIYMRCDFIGRSWCRSKSHTYTDCTHEATHPPTHRPSLSSSSSPRVLRHSGNHRDTRKESVYFISTFCHPCHRNSHEDTLSFRFSPGKRAWAPSPVKSLET